MAYHSDMLKFPVLFALYSGIRNEMLKLKPGSPDIMRQRQTRIDKLDAEARLFVGLLSTISKACTGPANVPLTIMEVEADTASQRQANDPIHPAHYEIIIMKRAIQK